MSANDKPATFESLRALDAALEKQGVLPLTPFWAEQMRRWYEHPTARALVGRVGRGGAKSHTSAKVALNEVLFGQWEVSPGEVHWFAFVSRLKEEVSQRKRLIEDFLTKLGIPFTSAGDEIVLTGRRVGFRVLAATVAACSGFRAIGFAIDELAKIDADDGYKSPAPEIVASLTSMCVNHPLARKLLISSPLGQLDYHFSRFELGNTDHQLVCSASSWEANPDGITEAQTHADQPDPKIWAREYAAIPSSTESGAFDADDATASFGLKLEPAGERFILTDPSDLLGDTWAWALCSQTSKGGIIVASMHGESDRVGPDTVVERIAQLARLSRVSRIFGDQRNGEWLQPAFSKKGLIYTYYPWSQGSKDTAIYKIRHLMRERALALPNDDRLKREVLGLRARMTPSGAISYQSNGKDFVSCLLVLGHAIAAGDVKASAVTSQVSIATITPAAVNRLENFSDQYAPPREGLGYATSSARDEWLNQMYDGQIPQGVR